MTVSSVTSTPAVTAPAPKASVRAADGDYLTRSKLTSQTKDADGDYKPVTKSSSPVAAATSAVQAALQSLKQGG